MASWQFLFVLIPLAAAFFGAHAALFFSVVRFFHLTSAAHQVALALVLAFFGISFFTSSLLTRFSENVFTRDLYFLSAFWIGLLVNLMLAIAAMWLLVWGASLVNAALPEETITSILFVVAFLYSIYGVWNAFNPRVIQLTAHIPNLPETWKGKKIVQLSDVHLGIVHRAAFMRDIVEKVNAENPAMVLITGDLFDGMDGQLAPLVEPLKELKAPKGIYFITGNHETYLGVPEALKALATTPVTVMKNEVRDVDGLKVIGIEYPNSLFGDDMLKALDALTPQYFGKPNILMYHAPVNIAETKARGVNLELTGHTHKGQLFPFGYITKLMYKGYDHGLFTEGEYTLYTTTGAGTWGPPMRTGNVPEIPVITLE